MSIVHIAFYPSDWLAGTRGLSDAETGVYITLIAKMYEMAGPIERDDERLYRLCGSKTKASFRKSLEYLISDGKILSENGTIYNERVQKEIKIVTEKSGKARIAAESRWNRKPNENKGTGNATASLEHMLQPCQSEPEPEPEERDADASLSFYLQTIEPDSVQMAFELFKKTAASEGWSVPAKFSQTRKSNIRGRLKDCGDIEGWKIAMDRAKASDFLSGRTHHGFRLGLDFFAKDENFTKLMEGNYDNRIGKTNGTGNGSGMARGATPEKIADFADQYVASKQAGG